ncbi:putative GCN1 [Cyclospora cayetanensis]|uniref:GCN1 n=1 Tax=Cyclospora cayetanensis TaxID=88456 RepID=A0A1D3CTD0_9EIME|nr:putative GCN1 [Cyclospora cayetanensis]
MAAAPSVAAKLQLSDAKTPGLAAAAALWLEEGACFAAVNPKLLCELSAAQGAACTKAGTGDCEQRKAAPLHAAQAAAKAEWTAAVSSSMLQSLFQQLLRLLVASVPRADDEAGCDFSGVARTCDALAVALGCFLEEQQESVHVEERRMQRSYGSRRWRAALKGLSSSSIDCCCALVQQLPAAEVAACAPATAAMFYAPNDVLYVAEAEILLSSPSAAVGDGDGALGGNVGRGCVDRSSTGGVQLLPTLQSMLGCSITCSSALGCLRQLVKAAVSAEVLPSRGLLADALLLVQLDREVSGVAEEVLSTGRGDKKALSKPATQLRFPLDRLGQTAPLLVASLLALQQDKGGDMEVARLASQLLERLPSDIKGDSRRQLEDLSQLLASPSTTFTEMAAEAFAAAVQSEGGRASAVSAALQLLLDLFSGRRALRERRLLQTGEALLQLLQFLLQDALVSPDVLANPLLQQQLLAAGVAAIRGAEGEDLRRDSLIPLIVQRLEASLMSPSAPSAEVQRLLSRPLTPLIKLLAASESSASPSAAQSQEKPPQTAAAEETAGEPRQQSASRQLVERCLAASLKAADLPVRRGGALGLAACIKGLGVISLRREDVLARLQAALSAKDSVGRQGALLCVEALSECLGRLFEPYTLHILGLLLSCLSDASLPVRAAGQMAARQLMKHLSSHGIRLVLPTLTEKLQDPHWRVKVGSIELLAAMAHCAPKQLGSCVNKVVPLLTDAASDACCMQQVRGAAVQALYAIGAAVEAPELQSVVPLLVTALADPSADTTREALDGLLAVECSSFSDAAALSLCVPVLTRGMNERSTELKRKAADLIGSLGLLCCHAQQQKSHNANHNAALLPYLPQLLPPLRQALGDPIPAVRTAAARACGAIARSVEESELAELLRWLLDTLAKSESSVERSGAANGLAELLVAWEQEAVREVALRAAEVIVLQFAATHTALLLRPLEDGLDDNPAVRQTAASAWKRVVANTPKTLKEILPILTRRLITNLAVPAALKQQQQKQRAAARCIGALAQKMGDEVLPQLLPHLEQVRQRGGTQS